MAERYTRFGMVDRALQRLQGTHEVRSAGAVRVAVRRDWIEALPLEAMLAGAPLRAWGEPLAHDLSGRAALEVLDTPRGPLVAKAITRGGLLGGWLPDRFVQWRRPWDEAYLAEELAARGCPTPPVVALRCTRGALGLQRLELATARVVGALDLLDALRGGADPVPLAGQAGRTLRQVHEAGLRHRDLQVKNLLVPREGAGAPLGWVIDLDRCSLGQPLDEAARLASLTRFLRSLVKRGILPGARGGGAAFSPAACRAFLGGYGALPGHSRARLCSALRRRLRRQLRWHGLFWESGAEGPVPGR